MFISQDSIALATPVADNGTNQSAAISMLGFTRVTVGLQSDHAGTLSLQRYLDQACTVPVGNVVNQVVTAGTPATCGFYDGIPAAFVIMKFQNNAGATANLTKISVLLAP